MTVFPWVTPTWWTPPQEAHFGQPPAQVEHEVRVSLMQGDIHYSAESKVLVTVLGSCVAVCLWDKVRGAGGMNHFVLPVDRNGEKSARYGDVAIDELLAGLPRLGCRIGDLQAKVFGGAAVLPFGSGQTVGSNNVQLALERLRRDHIRITAQRTGGTVGQQVRFHTRTGEAFVRYIPSGNRSKPRAEAPVLITPDAVFT
jgi:chemotaxis protein CheD